MSEDALVLSLSAAGLDAYCGDLLRQAPNGGHALAGLMALQSFLAAMASQDVRLSPAYRAAQAVIEGHAAQARARLMEESAAGLARAMRDGSRQEIARIHASLSRNGFWQAARQAIGGLNAAELAAASDWAEAWCREAKARAEAASGYPDALDFRQAGIAPEEYAAMTEVAGYLEAVRRLSA